MLTNELKAHLTGKILPFWEKLIDETHGGFFGYMDNQLLLNKEAYKGCIFNSRILWSFATAARVLRDERYLPFARQAYDFLQAFRDEENGGLFWSVTADGTPLDLTKHTYCQAFAIYGLAAYARATCLAEPIEEAMKLFRIIEDRCSDEGGYGDAYRHDFSPIDNVKLSENGVMATRTMNTLLHVLEAYAELYRASGSEEVRRAGAICLERFLKVMYNREKRRLEVFYDADYRSLVDMQSYGHDIEASWLIWDAVECLLPAQERAPYKAMCLDLADAVLQRAMTSQGLLTEEVRGQPDEPRVWWVQAEAVLGFANAYALTGEARYADAASSVWQATRRLLIDPRPGGEWFWSVHEDGSLTWRPMVEEWKGPYHNSRMCLRIIEQAKEESK